MSDHDRWLAGYSRSEVQVWCSKVDCELHVDGITITHESENGQGWTTPEECPVCHSHWLFDQPTEGEE